MAEEKVKVTGTTKTDPSEMSARRKWQEDVSSQLGADAIASGMFVNQMRDSFDKQSQFWTNTLRHGDMRNLLLEKIEGHTYRSSQILEGYVDFIKDAERKKLEAAMEAARKGDKKDKGSDIKPVKDMEFSWGGIAAGMAGALGAGLLAFKDKWGTMFTGFGDELDEFGKPKVGFFSKMKNWLGFSDEAPAIKELGKAKSGYFFNLKKYFGFEQKFPDELTKNKARYFDDLKKFLKFDTTQATAKNWKGGFTKDLNKMLEWSGDQGKFTDAAKKKFFQTQNNMLKWMDKAEDLSAADKAGFLKKQSKMLEWMAKHTDGMDKSKIKFLKDQSKFLKFAEGAEGLSDAAKIKFLKKHANILAIADDVVDASHAAKNSFFAKQLKMLGLEPKDVEGIQFKKEGMFSKLKTKIFHIGDDVAETISKTKTNFTGKMSKFLTFPALDETSKLGQVKTGFLTAMDNMLGTLLKITKGFFKLVNVLNFNALGFLNAEALAHPIKTFESFKASIGKSFGPEGAFTKIAKTFKAIVAPLTDWMKPIGGILKTVGKIAKVLGRIFIPIGFLFAAFDIVTNVMKGYEEGGISGAIGSGIESIFDDVLFAIPNLLGEAVAWILKKFDFNNAVKFIDENLRDSDGNFSFFTGIKNIFTMAVDALMEHIIDPVFDFFHNLPQYIAGMLMDMGKMGTWAAEQMFSEDTMKRAEMEKTDPAKYQKMIAAEKKQRDLEAAKENNKGGNTLNSVDSSSTQHSTVYTNVNRIDAGKKGKDSLKD
jgi:hypothetical protein